MSELLLNAPYSQSFLADVEKHLLELEGRLIKHAFFTDAQAQKSIPARDSCDFFSLCIKALESEYAPDLNSYSTMRWMYYLRRLPHQVFKGDLTSTAPNARALIEVYANHSTKTESATYGRSGFVFPVNKSTLRHIARFVAFITIIYDLQVGFRLASKGYDFAFEGRHARSPKRWPFKGPVTHSPMASLAPTVLPQRVANSELASAVEAYDQRHNDNKRTFLAAAMNLTGLALDSGATSDDEPEFDVSCACWAILGEEVAISPRLFVEGHPHAAHYDDNARIIAKYGFNSLRLDRMFELYRLPGMATIGVDHHTSLCLIVLLLGGRWLQLSRYSLLRTLELGYFIVNLEQWNTFGAAEYEAVCAEIREALPGFEAPVNFDCFRTGCLMFRGEIWPTAHGAPAKTTNDYICIDMWAASTGFLAWFQFPKTQGNVANSRAAKFEDVVQDAVERTRWGKSQHRELRQRPLRVNGQQLTDIDAIGEYEDTLLVISCKSIPYTREYDQGTHRAVRNAATTVDKGVDFWANIVGQLTANPIGDNFDFSGYRRIIGVVCTPFAIYTSDPKSLSMTARNLRWACSLDELVAFLKEYSDNTPPHDPLMGPLNQARQK